MGLFHAHKYEIVTEETAEGLDIESVKRYTITRCSGCGDVKVLKISTREDHEHDYEIISASENEIEDFTTIILKCKTCGSLTEEDFDGLHERQIMEQVRNKVN